MIGIVILNYNSWEDAITCIASIKQTTRCMYRIYLVDNKSTDNSLFYLNETYRDDSDVIIIESTENKGYAQGNNIGVRRALKDGMSEILISNTDVIFQNSAIDNMIVALESREDVAVVGPRIFDINGNDSQFASKLLTFMRFLRSKKPFCFLDKWGFKSGRYYQYDQLKPFTFYGMVSGCCFLIKTLEFENINFFDEHTFLFYEEDIVAYGLFRYMKMTMITPKALVVHNHSKTIKKEGLAFSRYHRCCSALYVLRTYVRINRFQLLVVIILIVTPFCVKSIYNRSYRKYLKKIINYLLIC